MIPHAVCPHCRRETHCYRFVTPDGHWLETHHCREHGDVAPRRRPVVNKPAAAVLGPDKPSTTLSAFPMPPNLHHGNVPAAARPPAARQEHDQWMKDPPDFDSKDLLKNWRRIRQNWGLTHDPSPTRTAPT